MPLFAAGIPARGGDDRALVLGITTLAVLSGLDGAQNTGAQNKARSEYSALAQQDIERLALQADHLALQLQRDAHDPSWPRRLLGLIANNFVRVYHPVSFGSGTGSPACSNTGSAGGRRIDAAILALQHSFIHDNWYCGAPAGDLTVYGAIAQKFRGPVGTGTGATITTGFRKDYVYNDRLRYREPPFFLDPVQASWRISRETEQVPAVKP